MIDEENKIGYVRLTGFSTDTALGLEQVLRELESQGIRGLVMDLRYNTGGLLDTAAANARFQRRMLIGRPQRLSRAGLETLAVVAYRQPVLRAEVEEMGLKVIAQYALMGQYDFLNILEAPNNEAVSKVAIELGSRGTLQTTTLAAMKLDDFIKNLKP